MHTHVPVSLLKTAVFSDVVQVVSADDNGALHLHLLHDPSENTTSDGHVASERAFLVNVGSIDRLNTSNLWGKLVLRRNWVLQTRQHAIPIRTLTEKHQNCR